MTRIATSRRPIRLGFQVAALMVAAMLVGCSDNKPTEPIPAWTFTGVLTQNGRSQHFFTMPESDVVRITLADVRAILVELPDAIENQLVLGVGLGRLSGASCQVTLPLPSRVGGTILVSLTQREHCIIVWDPSRLPEDASVEYTVTVEPQN